MISSKKSQSEPQSLCISNREKPKTQVIGLLSDAEGNPVSTKVFRGNTQDPSTFASQIEKAKKRFGREHVTFVGDRGMIKNGQIEIFQLV